MSPIVELWWSVVVKLIPLIVWTIFWKPVGLWYSARNGESRWFIAMTFINSFGILEIYYLHSRGRWPFKSKVERLMERKLT